MVGLASRKLLAAVVVIVLLSVGGGLALASGTQSSSSRASGVQASSEYSVVIDGSYDAAGNPSLVANFIPDGGLAKPRWSVCSPPHVTVCAPVTSSGQFLTPGPTPAGTVFEARAVYRGVAYVARTATWLGNVAATNPPRLTGPARYGAAVAAHRAGWSGGWRPDPGYASRTVTHTGGRGASFDVLNVEACRTRSARHCVNLTAQGRSSEFSTRPPVIGAWFTGWYLFSFDQRFGPDGLFALPGYMTPAAVPVVKAGRTVARSAPLGPVIGPPAPRVAILQHAVARRGRVLVARVGCSVQCRIWIDATGRRYGSSGRTTITGTHLVGVPRKRIPAGRVNVELYVGDGPVIHGTSRVR